eukprot:4249938-Alexandrium_andersonii.AAC.1
MQEANATAKDFAPATALLAFPPAVTRVLGRLLADEWGAPRSVEEHLDNGQSEDICGALACA